MKPLIVAFEGIDGSGKGVQLKYLEEKLNKAGVKTAVLDFPQYDSFFGVEIGKLLSGKYDARADKLDPKSMSLWYAMDRWLAFTNALKNDDFKDAQVVLLNRSTLSNAVYQVMRAKDQEADEILEWIKDLEFNVLKIPQVDFFFVFDVPVKRSRENVSMKGHRDYVGDDADVYEKNLDFLDRVRQGYLNACEKFPGAVKIDCMNGEGAMRPIDDIGREVLDTLLKKLEAK